MTPSTCPLCGVAEWRHVCSAPRGRPSSSRSRVTATNLATNAENTGGVARLTEACARTANRRNREDYNAYQRDLMRRRRAVKRLKTGFST